MRPVLFSFLGFDVQSYGLSKGLAALLAAFLLGGAFARRGLKKDDAYSLVIWATIWGFVGAKVYFLLEHTGEITWHHLGGSGFTWYGGLIGGIATFLVIIRRRHLPAAFVVDAAAIPLTLAYGVGRIGCWLSGDGTYGKPTSLPWGECFPNGMVATDVPVHPTPLYEVFAALFIAAILWWRQRRSRPPLELLGAYLILSAISRFLVEILRVNTPVLLGLTQPQLWAIASILAGAAIIVHGRLRPWSAEPIAPVSDGGTAGTHNFIKA